MGEFRADEATLGGLKETFSNVAELGNFERDCNL